MTNNLANYTTMELLNELRTRRMWFYTWSPETIKQDFASYGLEPPTDDECVELCERMECAVDDGFSDMTMDQLKLMRD